MNSTVLVCGKQRHKCYNYEYSKEDKSYIFKVEGTRKKTFRLPPPPATSLQITARYLIVQLKAALDANPTITITLGNDAGNHFNFAFSTVMRKERPSSSQMCALISLSIPKGVWVNICFDLQMIASIYWPAGAFEFLDSLEVSPTCSVRYIYAGATPLDPSANGTDLPKAYEFLPSVGSRTVAVPAEEPRPAERREAPRLPKPASGGSKRSPPRDSRGGLPRGPLPSAQNARQSTATRTSASVSPEAGLRVEGRKRSAIPVSQSMKMRQPPRAPEAPAPDEEESESESDDAFGSVAHSSPRLPIEIRSGLPVMEEEELELIYIESLGCYYCPSNQQYYQLDN